MMAFPLVAAVLSGSLAGNWQVAGNGVSATVTLPGTLAEARIGTRFTAKDWQSFQHGFSEFSQAYGPIMQSVWHGIRGEIA